jgi:hypothetical protein
MQSTEIRTGPTRSGKAARAERLAAGEGVAEILIESGRSGQALGANNFVRPKDGRPENRNVSAIQPGSHDDWRGQPHAAMMNKEGARDAQ